MNAPLAAWVGVVSCVHLRSLGRADKWRGQAQAFSFLALIFLFDLKNADNPASQHQPWKGRRIMNHHDVERIPIFSFGGGHKSPVVGIGQPGKQRFRQRECLQLRIVVEFRWSQQTKAASANRTKGAASGCAVMAAVATA